LGQANAGGLDQTVGAGTYQGGCHLCWPGGNPNTSPWINRQGVMVLAQAKPPGQQGRTSCNPLGLSRKADTFSEQLQPSSTGQIF
jgi:hypothetical protein